MNNERYFTPEAFAAEQEKHPIAIDINTLNVLYGITVCMLNLMLIFLADNAHNQAHFNDLYVIFQLTLLCIIFFFNHHL